MRGGPMTSWQISAHLEPGPTLVVKAWGPPPDFPWLEARYPIDPRDVAGTIDTLVADLERKKQHICPDLAPDLHEMATRLWCGIDARHPPRAA